MPTPPSLVRTTPGYGPDTSPVDNNFAALLAYIVAVAGGGGGGGGGSEVAPAYTASVGAGAAPALIHSGTGLLFGVLVVTSGSAGMTITDGASGIELAAIQASQPAGWIPFPSPVAYTQGIYANSGTGTPAVTISYA